MRFKKGNLANFTSSQVKCHAVGSNKRNKIDAFVIVELETNLVEKAAKTDDDLFKGSIADICLLGVG